MWRLAPKLKPKLDISVKYNPGMGTHKQCGANGYQRGSSVEWIAVPPLVIENPTLQRAKIGGDEFTVWIDDQPA